MVIDSPAVSGHHACVFREGDHFVVEDLASTNGTFVNGKRVQSAQLASGDRIQIGRVELIATRDNG